MELRPHQERAIQMLRDSIGRGNRNPILAAPCSFGKTITAAAILKSAAEKGKRGIFICDRVKLVQQALEAFDRNGLDFGVIQGTHELNDPTKKIQIASVQTLSRRMNRMPEFDIAIVDECHTTYKAITEMMQAYNAVNFIGLSATPFSRGLGAIYDDLVVPITPRELLEQNYLCPIDYYGGRKVALEGIGTRALSTGGSDYDPVQLAEAVEKDEKLVGDIVQNWMKYAEGRQTIAFSPSIKHSKFLVEQFRAAGIPAEHIDGYMDDDLRQDIYEAHDAGDFLVLSCSRLLNVGYDCSSVSCLIDAFPTRSAIAYVQRAGRIARTHEGKENSIYLDHSGNVSRFGFAEDQIPESLDDGSKKFNERNQIKEKKEAKVKDCPECYQQMVGVRCKCGYEIPMIERIETDGTMLEKLSKSANKQHTKEQKAQFLGELKLYARERSYSSGWVSHKYRAKYGVWPNKIDPVRATQVSEATSNFITSQNIRYAYSQQKRSA